MPTLYLVRHGRAAAGWDRDKDPGLDEIGHEQARRAAQTLIALPRMELIASPMRRTRETAAPLAQHWRLEPHIERRVSEIPSPVEDLEARGRWLREIAAQSWPALDASLRQWRRELLAALGEARTDTVVVTHFIAINVAAGAATGDERVVHFHPDYCSITVLRNDGGRLQLVQAGAEGTTRVL